VYDAHNWVAERDTISFLEASLAPQGRAASTESMFKPLFCNLVLYPRPKVVFGCTLCSGPTRTAVVYYISCLFLFQRRVRSLRAPPSDPHTWIGWRSLRKRFMECSSREFSDDCMSAFCAVGNSLSSVVEGTSTWRAACQC
jgi:hypothetical protein